MHYVYSYLQSEYGDAEQLDTKQLLLAGRRPLTLPPLTN